MAFTWDLYVDGQEYNLLIEELPNGKESIRVNGRIVARPMEKNEQECPITVAGKAFIVRRGQSGGFQVVEDPKAAAFARTQSAAKHALARSADSPLPMVKSGLSRQVMVIWGVAVALIAMMLIYATGPNYEKIAKMRMQNVLHEMKTGKNAEMQFAVGYWAMNQRVIDQNTMNWASDGFDKWRGEKDLYAKAFTNYEVTKSELVKGEKNPTAIVTFKIEGTEYRVRVPNGQPIKWEP